MFLTLQPHNRWCGLAASARVSPRAHHAARYGTFHSLGHELGPLRGDLEGVPPVQDVGRPYHVVLPRLLVGHGQRRAVGCVNGRRMPDAGWQRAQQSAPASSCGR